MKLRPIILLVSAWLFPWGVALAQDPGPLAPSGDAWGDITNASPPVAVALALAYGAFQLGQIVTKVVAMFERVLEKGIPIRVELAEHERGMLEDMAAKPPARRTAGG